MKKIFVYLSLIVIVPTLAACTPDQINSAIEACKGEPACYEIIDEAIEEELNSRGITGGKMTNVELGNVANFLQEFTFGENDNNLNVYKNTYIYWLVRAIDNENNDLWNQISPTLDKFSGVPDGRLFDLKYLDINTLGLFDKQLIFIEEDILNTFKILIYKSGSDSFIFELYLDKFYELKIDLKLNSIFIDNQRYISMHYLHKTLVETHNTNQLFAEPFDISPYGEVLLEESLDGLFVRQRMKPNAALIDYMYSLDELHFYPKNKMHYYRLGFFINNRFIDGELSTSKVIGITISKSFMPNNFSVTSNDIIYVTNVTNETDFNINSFGDLINFISENLDSDKTNSTFTSTNALDLINEIEMIFSNYLNQTIELF